MLSLLQIGDANAFLNELNTQVRSTGSLVYQIVMGIICITAIISLIAIGIKMASGDREGLRGVLAWCGILLFCLIAAIVIKNFWGV